MPFKSEAQKRYLFAKHPELAKKWAKEYPESVTGKLPEHAGKEKEASRKEHETYPISRTLTNPLAVGALTGTGSGLLTRALLENAGHSRASASRGALTAGVLGGVLGGGAEVLSRWLYAKGLKDKVERGGAGFTQQERRILLRGAKLGKEKSPHRSIPEHLISPTTTAIIHSVPRALAGNLPGAVFGGAAGYAGGNIDRFMRARSIAGRERTGGLTDTEKKLLRALRERGSRKD